MNLNPRNMVMNDSKYLSLTHRIAEETQLLAEEKWIIEALNKIKTQRNCLQIERLQLESMKSQLRKTPANKISTDMKMSASPKPPMTFSLNMMQNTSAPKPVITNTPNRKFLEAEATCNSEELNLGVTHPVFSSKPSEAFIIEEDEEEEDCGDLLLDMNMFMNCTQKQ